MMNFAEWPVVDVAEFEFVEIDVTRWGDTEAEYEYTAVLNFYRTVGEGETPNTGFTLCTHIGATSLFDLHTKIAMMVEAGFFDGADVQAMGTLYDEDHVELETIDWNSFIDDDIADFETATSTFEVNVFAAVSDFDVESLSDEQLKLVMGASKTVQ